MFSSAEHFFFMLGKLGTEKQKVMTGAFTMLRFCFCQKSYPRQFKACVSVGLKLQTDVAQMLLNRATEKL